MIPSPVDLGLWDGGWGREKKKTTRPIAPSCETAVLRQLERGRKGRKRKKAKEILWKRSSCILPIDFVEICSLLTTPTAKSNSHPSLYLSASGTFLTSSHPCPKQFSLHAAPAVSILEIMPPRRWTKAEAAHRISWSFTWNPSISPSPIITPISHLYSSHTELLPPLSNPVNAWTWGGRSHRVHHTWTARHAPHSPITYLSPTRQVYSGHHFLHKGLLASQTR